MSKHTPARLIQTNREPNLPAGVNYRPVSIKFADGTLLKVSDGVDGDELAAYIVRAVNAHEGLVRALELFLSEFDDDAVQMRTPIAYHKAVDAARAALSAAKE